MPQVAANKSARQGGRMAQKAVKRNAPEDTGDLKRGIRMKAERKVKVGKRVYDIIMDPAMNHIFVKTSADGKRSYYPASQEYGWMTPEGKYIPGYNYFRKSLDDNAQAIEKKIFEVAGKEVDKIIQRRGAP